MKRSEENDKKSGFGLVVEQRVSKWTPRAEIEKSINNFFETVKGPLSQACHIKKASIETHIYYDGRKKILQGVCHIPKETSEDVIDRFYYLGKAVWRSQETEPYDFYVFSE